MPRRPSGTTLPRARLMSCAGPVRQRPVYLGEARLHAACSTVAQTTCSDSGRVGSIAHLGLLEISVPTANHQVVCAAPGHRTLAHVLPVQPGVARHPAVSIDRHPLCFQKHLEPPNRRKKKEVRVTYPEVHPGRGRGSALPTNGGDGEEGGIHHRHHRTGRQLPGRVPA